jgi:hypothetical protein
MAGPGETASGCLLRERLFLPGTEGGITVPIVVDPADMAAKAVMVVRSVMRPGWGWRRTTVVCPPKTRSPSA